MARTKRRTLPNPLPPTPLPMVPPLSSITQPPGPPLSIETDPPHAQTMEMENSQSISSAEDIGVLTQPSIVTSSTTATKSKKRKDRSEAWGYFTRIENEGEETQAICKHCGAKYMADSNKHGTKNLKAHIKRCKVLQAKKGPMDNYTISHNGDGDGTSPINEMRLHKFDAIAIRDSLIEWIICDELPFMIVKSPKFKQFCKSMEPRFDVPSRQTIGRQVFKMYNAQKLKLKDSIRGSIGRVSLTTDMWTSSNNTSYMCITAHFIDRSWILHKRIISFSMVEDHRGEGIGKQLEKVTKEWGIEKIMCITVDNASSNDGAVDWMKKYGSKHVLGGNYLHVRCFAHILNLIVRHGLQKCVDSIEKIRNAVKYVRSSPKRQSKFLECANHIKVAITKSLCLDVPTRWNSTYLMLEVAVEYELVFDRLYHEDLGYRGSFLTAKVTGSPGFNDWENARKLVPFLKPFYDATTALSGSSYVTVNNYFFQFKAIRDHLNQARTNPYKVVSQVAVDMIVKYDQYFGNLSKVNMLVYVALVLDPRSKLDVFKKGLQITFDRTTSAEIFEGTKKLLDDLYEEYRSFLETPQSQTIVAQSSHSSYTNPTSSATSHSNPKVTNMWDIVCDQSEYATSLSRSEVDKYLADDRETPTNEFDLLNFWKVMEGRFPILASIARDIFSIPSSTVASESAFSTGGRVITDRRNSLLPRTVEALLCTQSWLKNVISIEANDLILDDDAAEEVERVAEEELDCGSGATNVIIDTSSASVCNVGKG